jgi:hypothetical protein
MPLSCSRLAQAAVWIVRLAALGAVLISAGIASAQDDFGQTPYVPTPQSVVDRMLEIAHVGPADYVIDLGSGDGRMVITAAKRYNARGFGVDLDETLVQRANRNAAQAGVSDRAVFYARDLFDTDMSAATVVTIYLLPEVNLMARPKLLATLKPGTRIVSHDYDMGEWTPDSQETMPVPDKPVGREKSSKIFFWVVPGNAAGKWQWQQTVIGKPVNFELSLDQNFQMLKGTIRAAGSALELGNLRLRGTELSFVAVDRNTQARYEFAGNIDVDAINGTMRASGPKIAAEGEWTARRTEHGTPAHTLLKRPSVDELKQRLYPQ